MQLTDQSLDGGYSRGRMPDSPPDWRGFESHRPPHSHVRTAPATGRLSLRSSRTSRPFAKADMPADPANSCHRMTAMDARLWKIWIKYRIRVLGLPALSPLQVRY